MIVHTYDPEVDMHYVYLNKIRDIVAKSVETSAVVDLDEHGNIIGFEILGVKDK